MKISKKRTKIVGTLGPTSNTKTILRQMVQAGMDTCRLNFSHGDLKEHANFIRMIREVEKEMDIPLGIIADLQGSRIRTGAIGGDLVLQRGNRVLLYDQKYRHQDVEKLCENCVPITYANLYKDVKLNDTVLIDGGLVQLKVTGMETRKVYCKVMSGGRVGSHKGLNVPTTFVNLPAITSQDKKHMDFAVKNGCDFIAISFVSNHKDILLARKLVQALEKKHKIKGLTTRIMAKIERHEALVNMDKIIEVADVIMVARGDLGLETPLAKVPLMQKEIVLKCLKEYKPVIIATQMLSSMVYNPTPTRSEISDVANAVIDHTHAVMLSEESAIGKFPVETIRTMTKIIEETEESVYDDIDYPLNGKKDLQIDEAIASVTSDVAENVKAKAILVISLSGHTARLIAKFRPQLPLIVAVNDPRVMRQLTLVWGVTPLLMKECKSIDELIVQAIETVKKKHLIKKGDKVTITAGQPVGRTGNTNWIKVHQL
ncbi:MAG: pyruvate kinase [bacterium]